MLQPTPPSLWSSISCSCTSSSISLYLKQSHAVNANMSAAGVLLVLLQSLARFSDPQEGRTYRHFTGDILNCVQLASGVVLQLVFQLR